MAEIKPFKAFFYNQEDFKDLSLLFCPPYDVISPQQQEYYHKISPYKFIHILLRKDAPKENRYIASGRAFKDWIKKGVLIQSKSPAIYFYLQEYTIRGEKKFRLGFIALLRLSNKGSSILGHENTHSKAKEDRGNLLSRTNANLSPIFVVFKDKKRVIQRVFDQSIIGSPPLIDVIDAEKTKHRIWSIEEPKIIEFVQLGIKGEDLFIADGHHRYEVSCAYRDKIRFRLKDNFSESASFNYTLSYFTPADQRGLSIMPIHRIVELPKGLSLDSFLSSIKENFDLEKVKERSRFFFLLEKGGSYGHIIGMYLDKDYFLLRLKNIKILDKEMPDKPKEYRLLDAAVLNQLVFKRILGINLKDKEVIRYTANPKECIEEVDSKINRVAFFLNPVKMEDIMAVALKDSKMPPKSTYFYPKLLSGLLVHKHDNI
jgi:uncharacterized protein (DUF1015 family)